MGSFCNHGDQRCATLMGVVFRLAAPPAATTDVSLTSCQSYLL